MTPQTGQASDGESTANFVDLPDDAIVYLHDDLSVTLGIARDEGVIFRGADPAWERYCREVLKFDVPAYSSDDGSKPEPTFQT
jgi:hypothetical protein